MKAIGTVEGGPKAIAEALLEAVAPAGTIMAYVSWDQSPYDLTLAPNTLTPEERQSWPAFNPATALPYLGFGALNLFLVQLPGAVRSPHPDASMVAVGARAEFLMHPHALGSGYGPGSPLERFVEIKGKVLMLGAPLDAVTVLHYAEAVARIRNKRKVRYEVPVMGAGGTEWRSVEELDSNGIVDQFAVEGAMDAVETIARAYTELGLHAEGKVGNAHCLLFDAADIVDFGIDYLENRFAGEAKCR